MPFQSTQIRSEISSDGKLTLSLVTEDVGDPGPDEVVVEMRAAPLNPSDLGLLFGPVDMTTARATGTDAAPVVVAEVPENLLRAVSARVGKSMPVGNEGAGVVVAAGASDTAQALMGRTVSMVGGASYSQYRKLNYNAVQALPEGTSPADGASWFVNPMTALCMLETMRMEGHTALVHTAAASNLGQMLCKLCQHDGVEVVHVVRKPAQVELLRGLGAKHVVSTGEDSFRKDLVAALTATGATLAFDAIGGGKQAGQILGAMEAAASKDAASYSRYGSNTHKQVYIYGSLDPSPTIIRRSFGFAWGVGGWLLTPTLQRVGGGRVMELRERVAAELTTTFKSHYTREVSLAEALSLDAIASYSKQATGEKFLITPHR